MRMAIGGIVHETNTYCRELTRLGDFNIARDDKLLRNRGTQTAVGGAIDECEAHGIDVVPLVVAMAQPSGIIEFDTYSTLKTELLERLSHALPLDGVFLDLHGAGVVESIPDLEADLTQSVRTLVGEAVPVTASFDLHGNVTQEMADALDGVFACHQYPHIDLHTRAAECIRLMAEMQREQFRPVTHVEYVPMLIPTTTTFEGIGQAMLEDVLNVEQQTGVIDISWFHGFPYSDVAHVGSQIVVTCRSERQEAESIAKQVASALWQKRELFRPMSLSADEAVEQALELQAAKSQEEQAARKLPVVINETSDNCGGGAPGDGTHLLRAMLAAKLENAAFGFIVDAEVAEQAHQAGVGAMIEVSLGGKTDDMHGAPLELTAYVKALHDGRLTMQAMFKGARINYGKLARLQVDGMEIIVGGRRSQTFDPEPFLAVGIDVNRLDIIALKSSNHFRAGFTDMAGTILTADPPGFTTHHIEVFPREFAAQPLWPLDEDAAYPSA